MTARERLLRWIRRRLDGPADGQRRAAEAALREELARLGEDQPLRAALRAGQGHAVLGIAAGYGAGDLAPFVRSLRHAGHAGQVVLFTLGTDAPTRAFLQDAGVRCVPFGGLRAMAMSMNSARMHRYLDWLVEAAIEGRAPARILLSDVRDVVFQDDPFATPLEGPLHFHLETGRTIGGCPVNSDWVRRALGGAALAELAPRPVSCAGTLLGTTEGVFDYLLAMVQGLLDVPPEHRFSGVDQAVHNAILWRGRVPGAMAVPNGREVLTIPAAGLDGLAQVEEGRLRNADGSLSAVVHQYDRDPAAQAALLAAYGMR